MLFAVRREVSWRWIAIGLAALIIAACGSSEDGSSGTESGALTVSDVWSRPVVLLDEDDAHEHSDPEEHDHIDVEAGMALFTENGCVACHGEEAQGTDLAPALAGHTADQVRSQVRNPRDQMPAFGVDQISEEELDQIAAYIANLEGSAMDHNHEHDDEASMGGSVGVVYLTIENAGDEDDLLVSATSDIATAVELHTVNVVDGVMQMRQVESGIELPAGETVVFEPTGLHIMLIGLHEALEVGDTFDVELEFSEAGKMVVESEVREQ